MHAQHHNTHGLEEDTTPSLVQRHALQGLWHAAAAQLMMLVQHHAGGTSKASPNTQRVQEQAQQQLYTVQHKPLASGPVCCSTHSLSCHEADTAQAQQQHHRLMTHHWGLHQLVLPRQAAPNRPGWASKHAKSFTDKVAPSSRTSTGDHTCLPSRQESEPHSNRSLAGNTAWRYLSPRALTGKPAVKPATSNTLHE